MLLLLASVLAGCQGSETGFYEEQAKDEALRAAETEWDFFVWLKKRDDGRWKVSHSSYRPKGAAVDGRKYIPTSDLDPGIHFLPRKHRHDRPRRQPGLRLARRLATGHRDRTFEITFLAPGVEAYAFTFG
jgi:hypothetical protein